MYILQGGVRWYANCGFSSSSSMSYRTGMLFEIRPDNKYKPLKTETGKTRSYDRALPVFILCEIIAISSIHC
jgi:hypothetical protein